MTNTWNEPGQKEQNDIADTLELSIEIEKHIHPLYTITTPNALKRLGAIRIASHGNTENVVLGSITYIFMTTLGSPGVNEVHVKIQSTVMDSVKMMLKAMQGLTDADNIAYNVQAFNATSQALWTGQILALGASTLAAAGGTGAATLYFRERDEDQFGSDAIVSTTTNTQIAFNLYTSTRYTTVANGIRGEYLAITGLGVAGSGVGAFGPFRYDANRIDVSDGSGLSGDDIEADFYYSLTEEPGSFVRISEGANLAEPAIKSANPYGVQEQRPPLGAGLYIKIGTPSDATAARTLDFSIGVHLYPIGV